MKRYITYTLLMLLLAANVVLAQKPPSVSGKVTWSHNGEPIQGAEVIIEYTEHWAVTNEKGEYRIENVVPPGTYTVIAYIRGEGVEHHSKKVEVGAKGTVHADFTMDSIVELGIVTILDKGEESSFGIARLKNVEGMAIYASKKNEVILMSEVVGNLATNNPRQVYSKVTGLNIWESDGAGIQLGIGGRGLSPNRTSNFNTRQNGYDISADALGYPESYYSPPSEAVDRIEIVRGAASLQYGTQFGGMVNFKLKQGAKDKKVQTELRQTVGSFGLFNTFNSIGGTVGKWNYYGFYQYKRGNGWRPNSEFDVHTAYTALQLQATEKLRFSAEYTHMSYLAHQPGGLTDVQFEQDPRQSIRDRNWFKVRWNLAAFNIDYRFNDQLKLNVRNFGLVASRSALGFLGQINRIDPGTERDLLVDDYLNIGNETRLIYKYRLRGNPSTFLVGGRFYHGLTDRKQGLGNDGDGADFYFQNPNDLEHSEYDFPSTNVALFAENIFAITPQFSITPGVRFEYIDTRSDGYYTLETTDLAGNILISEQIEDNRGNGRAFVLFGMGMSYKPREWMELYGNFSQNYRSINFNDMRVVNPNFQVDPNLQDETGFSTDVGVRGRVKEVLSYDVSLFLMSYNDRIGSVLATDSSNFNVFRLRTNISDSRNIGLETFVEVDVLKLWKNSIKDHRLLVFSNFTYMDARYVNSDEKAFDGNKVELAPSIILKTGLSYRWKELSISYQYAYTAEHFTDATNAERTANAVNGIIPSYGVMDLSASYTWRFMELNVGVNNLANNMYFTRRAEGYPGPGIIPSDGRNFYITLAFKF